jgi:phospholipase D1/2
LILRGFSEDLSGVQRPPFPVGGYIKHPIHSDPSYYEKIHGLCEIQIVRSSADWSHGILPNEQSIQNAYKDLIEKAQNFIYIENQFFITATGDQQKPIYNQVGRAIVNAIERAFKENRQFRVILVIPAIPGFPGDLRDESAEGTRAIIDYQYKSICRGENSIYGRLNAMGIDPTKYLFVFNLRIYGRIHTTAKLVEREKATGAYTGLQTTNANDILGNRSTAVDSFSLTSPLQSLPILDVNKAAQRRRIFEQAMNDTPVQDTIAKNTLKTDRTVADEEWDDNLDNDQEKIVFVQEEIYVHAKIMIVDDESLIVGSSNINDRSQLGDHDSELSAVVKHHEVVSTLRKRLWMEHLGLLKPQKVNADDDGGDPSSLPPGINGGNIPDVDPIVEDPMSEQLWKMWTTYASTNTEIYRDLFHSDPDDSSNKPPPSPFKNPKY